MSMKMCSLESHSLQRHHSLNEIVFVKIPNPLLSTEMTRPLSFVSRVFHNDDLTSSLGNGKETLLVVGLVVCTEYLVDKRPFNVTD